jgi:hypothetical protein
VNTAVEYKSFPHIRTPEDLGFAFLGNPNTAIVPPKRRIDRAEYGRRLAAAEGGIFTPCGYLAPATALGGVRNKGDSFNAESGQ